MRDDIKAKVTINEVILSKKHIKSDDIVTQQIQMLELMGGVLRTIRLVRKDPRFTRKQHEREIRALEIWRV